MGAEAEADADAFYGYAGYPYAYGAYPYNYGYAGYPYAYAHHVAAPVATGTAQVSPSASLTTVGLADASIPAVAGGYAGAGRYVANSAGVVHVAKSEAESEADVEADPALFYSAYGYAGYPYNYGYAGYPYSTAYPYSYGYPYAYGSYAHVAAPAVTTTVEAAPAVATVAAAPAVAAVHAAPVVAAPVATGYAQVSPSASLTTVGLADSSIPAVAGGYAGAGRYVANSAG